MGDGLEGNIEREWHCDLSRFVSTDVVVTIPEAERMLATTSLAPLLVNLQSMTSKPNAGGGSKNPVTWKVEEVVHNFVHADKVTTNSSAD